MGRYATPGQCLDCRAWLVGAALVCPACGLPQVGREAELLRTHLERADEALAWARATSAARLSSVTSPEPVVEEGGEQPAPVWSMPLLPTAQPPARTRTLPAVSTPVVLLGLGAVCVLVAAVVFVTVSWSDLSLAAKAAILLCVTALIGMAGQVSLKRRLRGSAETFSTLFVVFVVLDFLSARWSGLAGVDALSATAARWTVGILAVVVGVGWAVLGRRGTAKVLVGVQIVAAVGVVWLSTQTLVQVPWRPEYVALCLVAVTGGLAWAALTASLRVLAVALASTAFGLFALAWLVSLSRLVEAADLLAMWGSGRAAGWLVCCLLLAGVTVMPALPSPARWVAAPLSATGLTLLALRPLEGSAFDVVLATTAGVCIALAVSYAVVVVRGPWHVGVGLSSAGPGILAAFMVLPSLVEAGGRAVQPATEAWQLDVTDQVAGIGLGLDQGSAVTVLLAMLALGAAALALTLRRPPSVGSAAIGTAAAAAIVVIRHPMPMWQPVAILAAVTAVCVAVAVLMRQKVAVYAALAGAGVTLTSALGSEVASLMVAASLSVGLFAVLGRPASAPTSHSIAAGAVAMTGLTLAAALAVVDSGQDVTAVSIGLLGACVFVAAQLRRGEVRLRARLGFELGAGVLLAVGLMLGADYVDVVLPVAMTFTGVALAAAGLLSSDRRLLVRPAGVFFAAATWIRLWAQGVTVIEAYTLPSAVALCLLGGWRMRRTPASQSLKVLGPGLSLALLPSLLVAVTEPTSLRALLLGLAALVVLGGGAVSRWAAPLLAGSGVVLVLALVNMAPYAAALPRWVIFATAGAGLLFAGVTWEHRLRDAKMFASAVRRLH